MQVLYFVIILLVVVIGMAVLFLFLRKEMGSLRQETENSVNSNMEMFRMLLQDSGKNAIETQVRASESQKERLDDLQLRMDKLQALNQIQLEKLQNNNQFQLEKLQSNNQQQLEKIQSTVDEKLQKTLEERISHSFQTVNESLTQVSKGLGEMRNLAGDVGGLKKVLGNVKTRGILGEYQLQAILEEILAPAQYSKDVDTRETGKNHVEFAVKLPGNGSNPVWLPIDAKFPGDTYRKYLDACENGEKAEIEVAKAALRDRLYREAKDISEKYVEPPKTTNFAIMFLPFEGLYAEACNMDMVTELMAKYNVNIAGPSTLAAILNSLQMGFSTLAIEKRADDIIKTLAAVKTEFTKFKSQLEKAQRGIGSADKAIDTLLNARTNAIIRNLKEVEQIPEHQAMDILDLEGDLDSEL